MSGDHHMIIQHAAATSAKTTGGGLAVAAVSYVGTEKFIQALPEPSLVAQATEIATLVAAIMTAFYFFLMALHTGWKFIKDVKGNK